MAKSDLVVCYMFLVSSMAVTSGSFFPTVFCKNHTERGYVTFWDSITMRLVLVRPFELLCSALVALDIGNFASSFSALELKLLSSWTFETLGQRNFSLFFNLLGLPITSRERTKSALYLKLKIEKL